MGVYGKVAERQRRKRVRDNGNERRGEMWLRRNCDCDGDVAEREMWIKGRCRSEEGVDEIELRGRRGLERGVNREMWLIGRCEGVCEK